MSAQEVEAGELHAPIYSGPGVATFTEPFPCRECRNITRPPRVKADAEGMPAGSRSYGGRGLCSACYRDHTAAGGGKRREYRQEGRRVDDVAVAHAEHALQGFLRRRRQRLQAGSAAVVATNTRAPGVRAAMARPVRSGLRVDA